MLSPLVLVVEDDAALRSVLSRGLREEGFRCEVVATGAQLLGASRSPVRTCSWSTSAFPTATGGTRARPCARRGRGPGAVPDGPRRPGRPAGGIRGGGDDYMAKPFSLDELVARLRALVRRGSRGAEPTRVGGVALDPALHALASGGQRVRVTPTEFRIAAALFARPGRPSGGVSSSAWAGHTARSSTTTRWTPTSPA